MSCSKDSDLLSYYVINNEAQHIVLNKVVDDKFTIDTTDSVLLDVLRNDNFKSEDVQIVSTSSPLYGTIDILADNILYYVLNDSLLQFGTNEKIITDSFTYNVKISGDNETNSSEIGSVTIEIKKSHQNIKLENSYFVTAEGKASNDGLSENNSWNLSHAIETASAGDIIYIKAGTYITNQLEFRNSGNSENPIRFIGYNKTPDDIVSKPHGTMNYGDNINDIGFPVLNPNNGIALFVRANYIELHNIGITDPEEEAEYGVLIDGDFNVINNLAFSNLGSSGEKYDGIGVAVRGSHNKIINSFGENCGAEGFTISPHDKANGNDNVVKNNAYYNDNLQKMTDYFFTVSYKGNEDNKASRNLFEGNEGYRLHDGNHWGHGLANAGGNGNVWRNNLMHRSRIELRYKTSYNILYEGNRLTGFDDTVVTISNGVNNVTLRNNYIEADFAVIIFNAIDAYNSNKLQSSSTGHDIVIYNNIFIGGKRTITFGEEGIKTGASENITISNNIFDSQKGGFRFYTNVFNLIMDNNIFSNSTSLKWEDYNVVEPNIYAHNNLFYNNAYETPTKGFNSTLNKNPLFTYTGNNIEKFIVKANSPVIDAGKTISFRRADFYGKVITGFHDIGVFEY